MLKEIARVKAFKLGKSTPLTSFEMSKGKLEGIKTTLQKEQVRLENLRTSLSNQHREWSARITIEETELALRSKEPKKNREDTSISKDPRKEAKPHPSNCGCRHCYAEYRGKVVANIKPEKPYKPYTANALNAVTRLIDQGKQFQAMIKEELDRNTKLLDKVKSNLWEISVIQSRLKSIDLDIEVTQMLRKRNASMYAKSSNPLGSESVKIDMEAISREVQQMQYSTEALLELGHNA